MSLKVIHSPRNLTGHAGLLAVGHCLNQFAQLPQVIDPAFPIRGVGGIANSDVLRAYVGLLSMGKSDFEAIENHRHDDFFKRALNLRAVPSIATLRLRLDALAVKDNFLEAVDSLSVRLLKRAKAPVTLLSTGHAAVDVDVFCMDNSDTKKEGVSRTYAGFDGYAPIAGYLGLEGWCLGVELRDGKQHSAKETHYFLQRLLPRAASVVEAPLLLRMDSGFDSKALVEATLLAHQQRVAAGNAGIDLLVKWNPRTQGQAYIDRVQCDNELVFTQCREGKRQTSWVEPLTQQVGEQEHTLYRHIRVSERTIDKRGQQLLIPQWDIEGWVTTLDLPTDEVIALYADHATHEQYHSEFKTDMDIERLPSGKFATNDAILSLAMLAYNCLRLIGQNVLLGPKSPVRHKAKRRRLRTVMQEIIYRAALLTRHARQYTLDLGGYAKTATAFATLIERWQIRIA